MTYRLTNAFIEYTLCQYYNNCLLVCWLPCQFRFRTVCGFRGFRYLASVGFEWISWPLWISIFRQWISYFVSGFRFLGRPGYRLCTAATVHYDPCGRCRYIHMGKMRNTVDVDVVKLRAQANASMPASYNSNIQLLILILISNNNSDFRFHEFRL